MISLLVLSGAKEDIQIKNAKFLLIINLLLLSQKAEAFCPLCVFGAGAGLFEAAVRARIAGVGMWTGGLALALLYLRAKGEYRMTKAAAAFFFCSPFLFAAPLAAELYRSGWQPAALIDALVPSATGLAAGFAVSFASAVLACVISRLLPFKIPFLRLTVVLSALYYTDCCFF